MTSQPKISLMGSGYEINTASLPILSSQNIDSNPTSSLLANSIYLTNRQDALLRSSNKHHSAFPSYSSGLQTQNRPPSGDNSKYVLLKVDSPGQQSRTKLPKPTSLLSPTTASSQKSFFPTSTLLPPSLSTLNTKGQITPAGVEVEYDAQGNKHLVQHVLYKEPKEHKDHKEHKDKSHKKKKEEKSEDQKILVRDEKPSDSILEHYLDRQNELMARLMKDFQEDKKLESQRQQELLERITNSSRYSSLPKYSSEEFGRRSERTPSYFSPPPQMSHNCPNCTTCMCQSMHTAPSRRYPQCNHNHQRHNCMHHEPSCSCSTIQYNSCDFSDYDEPRRRPPPKQQRPYLPVSKQMPKKQNRNRSNGRRLLKVFAWTMVAPGLWFRALTKWCEERRREEYAKLREYVPKYLDEFFEYVARSAESDVLQLVNEKKSMVIVTPKKLTPKEYDARCLLIKDHLITILDHLTIHISPQHLPETVFELMASFSENDSVAPSDFFTRFELARLSFSVFGNLRNMNESRSKMILACFLLLKGVLYFVLMKPWTVIRSLKEKTTNMKNLINTASVFYHIVMEMLNAACPLSGGPKFPFKNDPPVFQCIDPEKFDKLDVPPPMNEDDSNTIIHGLYTREQVSEFLDSRPAMVREIKESIVDFLEVLHGITRKVREPKQHVRQRFASERRRW